MHGDQAYPSEKEGKEQSQISRELDGMDKATSGLNEAINALEARLEMVLRKEAAVKGDSGTPAEALAGLPSLMRDDRDNINGASARLRDLTARLVL